MIQWSQIDLKNRTSGAYKTTCPACSESRKKKKDPCLSVNIDKGVARCWNCDDISIRDWKEKVEPEYKAPPQEWRNYTALSDNLVKWFADRGISQKTLIECKITEERHYQPAKQKEVNNVVFNYFEGTKLVNKKYRSADKCFTQIAGAKKIFYGLNDVIADESCYIVEGEIDKLSFWEIGISNCISVPNGAKDLNSYFETCEQYIKDIKIFYIAVDMDDPGRELEQNLVKRLGKYRCKRIHFKNKDANDDLKESRLELEESLKRITDYPVDGTFTAKDVKEGIYSLYVNGLSRPMAPANPTFAQFNESFKILKGQLTVVTGIPSHGKSNWLEWYCLNLINDLDLKMSLYSPEHFPMELHHSILAEKVIGKPFYGNTSECSKMTEQDLQDYIEWSSDRVYLTCPEKAIIPDWDWVFDRFNEQLFRYGIDVFVIDAFNKVKMKGGGTLYEINEVLGRLTLFAQMHNIHIFLIAHPTKMRKKEDGKFDVPTLYDVKGSGDFYDQTHNGLTVYRHFDDNWTEVIPQKLKFKHQGKVLERTAFKYCISNGRYYSMIEQPSYKSIIKKHEINYQPEILEYGDDPPF